MIEDPSTSWDREVEITYNIVNHPTAETMVNILDQARVNSFKLQMAFKNQYQMAEFHNECRLQTEGEGENAKESKKRYKTFIKKPENYPKQSTMELGQQEIRSRIFMHVFGEEVGRIESENNYKVFSDRTKLRIFMKEGCQLNMLTKHKLLEMNEQLQLLHSCDQALVVKFSKSKKLRDELKKHGIIAWFKWYRMREFGYFFSTKMVFRDIYKIVQDIAKYNLSLFNLRSRSLSRNQNQSVFYLIKESIAADVAILEEEYQVMVQFSEDYQFIVVHKKHACFGVQVEASLKKLINNLLLISIQSKEIRKFNNLLKKGLKQMPFLKERMNSCRNQTFLSINVSQIALNSKHFETFLRYFKIVVDKQLFVKVFFNNIDSKQSRQEIDRVIKVAEDNNFILKNEEIVQRYVSKGFWKMKDLSEAVLEKRQRELISFIKALILRQESNPKQLASLVDSFFEENSLQSNSVSRSELFSIEQKLEKQEKGRIGWFTEEFKMPKVRQIEENDRPFILGTRRRDLEKVFETKTRAKFKIWTLELNCNINWPVEVEQSPIFLQNAFVKRDFNQRFKAININSLPLMQMGMVVHMSKKFELRFVPVFLLQRIG